MATGCLWNSFMMVGQVPTLLGLFIRAMPGLYVSFSKIRPSLGTVFERETVRRLYDDLRTADFSRDVLESLDGNLGVLTVRDVEWSDLGEPHRVARIGARLGAEQKWAAA
jgi:mannose-1-phosphate guanylyltransferase